MPVAIALSVLVHVGAFFGISFDYGTSVPERVSENPSQIFKGKHSNSHTSLEQRKKSLEAALVQVAQDYLLLEKLKGLAPEAVDEREVKSLESKLGRLARELNPDTVNQESFKNWFILFADLLLLDPEAKPLDQMKQTQLAFEKLEKLFRAKERHFERLYETSAQPKWLVKLNYRRKILHNEFFKSYSDETTSVHRLVLNRSGNALADSLLILGIVREQDWLKDLPEHQLGIRVFNDHISPVIIMDSPKEEDKKLSMDLLTGETEYLAVTRGHIYTPSAILHAFLMHFKAESPIEKSELLLFESQAPSQHDPRWENFLLSIQSLWSDVKLENKGVFVGARLSFGIEAYDYVLAEPYIYNSDKIRSKMQQFKTLSLQPNINTPSDVTQADSKKEDKGKKKGENERKESVDDAIEEVTGQKAAEMSDEEKLVASKKMLESAKNMAEMAGNEELAKQIESMDPELFEKAEEEPEALTELESINVEKMSKVLIELAQRKAQAGETPDFVANPIIRVAKVDELNEFDEYAAFIVKKPELEELAQRRLKSLERRKVENGFDYYLLQPEVDIVLRTQQEVDLLNRLTFIEKFNKLLKFTEVAVEEVFIDSESFFPLQELPNIVLAALNEEQYDGRAMPRDLKEVFNYLESVRSVVEPMNQVIVKVYQYSRTDQRDEGEFYYYNPESISPYYRLLPAITKMVVSKPLEFIEKLNKNKHRNTILKLLVYFQKWQAVAQASRDQAPSYEAEILYAETWAALTEFWDSKIFQLLNKPKEVFSQLQGYTPQSVGKKYGPDLFQPFIPLLPFIADENYVQILGISDDIYDCQKRKVWINLPKADWGFSDKALELGYTSLKEWAESDGQRCLVTYNTGAQFIELSLGSYLVERLPYVEQQGDSLEKQEFVEAFENVKLQISPTTYLGLVLAQPQEQLNHPLVQLALLQRFNKDILQVLSSSFIEPNPNQIIDLLMLPVWTIDPAVSSLFQPWEGLEIRLLDLDSSEAYVKSLRVPYPRALADILAQAMSMQSGDKVEVTRTPLISASQEASFGILLRNISEYDNADILAQNSSLRVTPVSFSNSDLQMYWQSKTWEGLANKDQISIVSQCRQTFEMETISNQIGETAWQIEYRGDQEDKCKTRVSKAVPTDKAAIEEVQIMPISIDGPVNETPHPVPMTPLDLPVAE